MIPRPSLHLKRRAMLTAAAMLPVLAEAPAAAPLLGVTGIIRRDETIGLPNWPDDGRPCKVAILSDLHVCAPYVTLEQTRDVAREIAAAEPDLVILPGDYISGGLPGGMPASIEAVAAALSELPAAAPCFTVRGNHDTLIAYKRWAAAMAKVGIQPLAPAARFRFAGTDIRLAGMGWTLKEVGAGKAAIQEPFDGPTIVVAHTPDVVLGRPFEADLVIAGHTHGGQIRVPLLGPLITRSDLPAATARGLTQLPATRLYVSAGIGMSGVPVRLDCPPEWTMLTLGPVRRQPLTLEAGL